MKNALIIILLALLLAPFPATYFGYRVQRRAVRREIKHKMMEGISKKELVCFRFTAEQAKTSLRWKHSREFEFQGKMYDIVEKCTEDDTTVYYCWPDNKESSLNKKLGELLAVALGHDRQQQDRSVHLKNFLKSLYCSGGFLPWMKEDISIPLRFPGTLLQYCSVFISPAAPPPKLA